MKLTQKHFRTAGALAIAGIVSTSQAARYVVRVDSPMTFQRLSRPFTEAMRASPTRDIFGRIQVQLPAFPGTVARISNALENLNMLVVETNDPAQIERITRASGVAYVEKEKFFAAPKMPRFNDGPAPMAAPSGHDEEPWGLGAVRAQAAWAAATSGAKGQGARVVILDTGIDRDHPDLANQIEEGKNFFPRRPPDGGPSSHLSDLFFPRVEFANDDTIADMPYDFYDQIGHGTHVAGTIAGNQNDDGVVGVAPLARLFVGRVCGQFGCSSLGIINGANWAVQVGAHVINMSLGGPQDSQAQHDALNAAERAGVMPVAAAGNSGTPAVSFPGAYESVLSVGALNPDLTKAEFSQWGPELDVMAPGVDVKSAVPMGTGRDSRVASVTANGETLLDSTSFVGAPEVSERLTGSLVPAGLGKVGEFPASVRGKFALVKRGEIPFGDKVKNALIAGATGVVVYNNEPGLLSGAITTDGSVVAIPVVMIKAADGERILASIASGATETVSVQTLRTNYAAMQGTSMASPHVAGVAALVRAANPRLTPEEVRALLKSTATPLTPSPDNRMGSGLVNAEAAVRAAQR